MRLFCKTNYNLGIEAAWSTARGPADDCRLLPAAEKKGPNNKKEDDDDEDDDPAEQ